MPIELINLSEQEYWNNSCILIDAILAKCGSKIAQPQAEILALYMGGNGYLAMKEYYTVYRLMPH